MLQLLSTQAKQDKATQPTKQPNGPTHAPSQPPPPRNKPTQPPLPPPGKIPIPSRAQPKATATDKQLTILLCDLHPSVQSSPPNPISLSPPLPEEKKGRKRGQGGIQYLIVQKTTQENITSSSSPTPLTPSPSPTREPEQSKATQTNHTSRQTPTPTPLPSPPHTTQDHSPIQPSRLKTPSQQ